MNLALRCNRCSKFMGDARQPMEFIGIFKNPQDRYRLMPGPLDTILCKSCGWLNVFQPVEAENPSWRKVEVKRG